MIAVDPLDDGVALDARARRCGRHRIATAASRKHLRDSLSLKSRLQSSHLARTVSTLLPNPVTAMMEPVNTSAAQTDAVGCGAGSALAHIPIGEPDSTSPGHALAAMQG